MSVGMTGRLMTERVYELKDNIGPGPKSVALLQK